ncbi:hypothetical protein HA39_18545 [Pantoea brenneri]|nr:hypothetical protein HA39_18545 [Pantoea brenneri]
MLINRISNILASTSQVVAYMMKKNATETTLMMKKHITLLPLHSFQSFVWKMTKGFTEKKTIIGPEK